MYLFLNVLQFIQALLMVYILLLTLRVFMSFLGAGTHSPAGLLLGKITDPYLNFFRRFNLRFGMFDLSPVLAIGVVYVVSSVLSQLPVLLFNGRGGLTNPLFYVVLVLQLVWAVASAVIFLFVLGLCLRALALAMQWNGQIWLMLDKIYQPLHMRFFRLFTKKFFPYQGGLWVLFGIGAVIYIVLSYYLVPYGLWLLLSI